MTKKNLIVASIEDVSVAYACAIITRFLCTGKNNKEYPEILLAQPGQLQEELSEQFANSEALDAVFFLGELFPEATEKKAVGDALEKAVGKGHASRFVYLNGSAEHPKAYISGKNRQDARYQDCPSGLLASLLAYCKEQRPDFRCDDILAKQKDDYIQYCLRNALNEFRLHRESTNFTKLIRQLSEVSANDLMPTLVKPTMVFGDEFSHDRKRKADKPEAIEDCVKRLSGKEWSELLRTEPGAAIHCGKEEWGKLNGRDWCDLLKERPEFFEQCGAVDGWTLFTGEEWAELLYKDYTRYKDICEWDELSRVNSRTFVRLLERHPEVVRKFHYDWARLEMADWADLLEDRPQFASHCRSWQDFNGEDWVILLSEQAQFESQCNEQNGWSKIDSQGWCELLQMQSGFAGKCPEEIWLGFSAVEWLGLLTASRPLLNECSKFNGWQKLDGACWCALLKEKPEMAKWCTSANGWRTLNGSQWCSLLIQQPIFEEHFRKSEGRFLLSDEEWIELLKVQPKFNKYHGETIKRKTSVSDWVALLAGNPLLVEQCDCLNEISDEQWEKLLQRQPELFHHCPAETRSNLKLPTWISLLGKYPELSLKCTIWRQMNGTEWSKLLSRQAQYANRCTENDGWQKMSANDWVALLTHHPQMSLQNLSSSFWEELTSDQWITLVSAQPLFVRRQEFRQKRREFNGMQWCRLLASQPQLASDDVPWDKFKTENWLVLLKGCSCFNERFSSSGKMKDMTLEQWVELLCTQPVFMKDCPMKNKISVEQWKRIVFYTTDEEILPFVPLNVLHSLKEYELSTFLKLHPHGVNYVTSEQLDNVEPFVWARTFVANGFKLPGKTANDLSRMDGSAWAFLLIYNKDYCTACTQNEGWKLFNGNIWSDILAYAPEFANYCDKYDGWELMDGNNWRYLLTWQPQFANQCNGAKLTSAQLLSLLIVRPELKGKIKKSPQLPHAGELSLSEIHRDKFSPPAWVFKNNIQWDALSNPELARILVLNPKLEEEYSRRGLFKVFGGVEWYIVLRHIPAFAKYCPFELLSPQMRLACLSLDKVAEKTASPIPWPLPEEMNRSNVINGILEDDKLVHTVRNGKLTPHLIDWMRLTSLNYEYAVCCPQKQWDELSIQGWKQLEMSAMPRGGATHPNAAQEEQLWSYYSAFLRLPQDKLDAYARENPKAYEEIRLNALIKYRGMLVGEGLKPLREQLRLAAKNCYPVLILGESGTGKENAARMLHTWSGRDNGHFEAFNCAASNSNLIESTLFGHTKGAFTGADRETKGIISKADHGTLFFDEIAEFPLETQAKLLRVMQRRSSVAGNRQNASPNPEKMVYAYHPVGGEDAPEMEVDVRFIAATNKNLEQMIAGEAPDGQRFREDLYYRLNSIVIETLPLREHRKDIAEIANLFWRVDLGNRETLKQDDVDFLESLDYPANVRQLQQLLIQYSVYQGHRTLQEIHDSLLKHRKPMNADVNAERTPPVNSCVSEDDSDKSEQECILLRDEKTGTFKTAETIDREYARLVRAKLGQSLAETATVLGLSINTLRRRLM